MLTSSTQCTYILQWRDLSGTYYNGGTLVGPTVTIPIQDPLAVNSSRTDYICLPFNLSKSRMVYQLIAKEKLDNWWHNIVFCYQRLSKGTKSGILNVGLKQGDSPPPPLKFIPVFLFLRKWVHLFLNLLTCVQLIKALRWTFLQFNS